MKNRNTASVHQQQREKSERYFHSGKIICLCCWFKNLIIQNHSPKFNIQHYDKLLFHYLLFAKLLNPELYVVLNQGVELKISMKNVPHVKEMHIVNNSDNIQYTYLKTRKQSQKAIYRTTPKPRSHDVYGRSTSWLMDLLLGEVVLTLVLWQQD